MFNENHVLRTTIILTLLLGLGSACFRLSVGLGFLLGGLISTLALRLLIVDNTNLLRHSKEGLVDKKRATRYSWKSYLKRCSLYAGALIIAILNPYLNFLATFAGLLLPRAAIIYHVLRGRTKRGT